MFTSFLRVVKYGVQGFLRNIWLSTATVMVMVLAVLVFEGLIIFGVVTNNAIASIQDKIDISVYFKTNTSEDDVLKVKRSLESLVEVKDVEYISRDDALASFKERHTDNQVITQALSELKENPLLASLNIKAKDPKFYAAIASYLDNESLNALVDKVTYTQNQLVIERLIKIVDTARQGGILLTILLALTAVLVTFNTVRLAIYSNREEIEVMRLVGGSNNFISGPYMVGGFLYGVMAALISFILVLPVIFFIAPYVAVFIPGTDLVTYLTSNFAQLFIYLLAFGAFLGIISSTIAVRRYLRG